MNLHQKAMSPSRGGPSTVRYEMAYSRDNPLRVEAFERLAALATARYFGSKRVFPRRFDRAFTDLLEHPAAAKVIPEYAIRYYGSTLHLDIDPLSLRHRVSDWVSTPEGIRWMGTSFLDSADWSAVIAPVVRSPIHREMQEFVAVGGDLRDTRAYRDMMLAIKLGRPTRRNSTTLTNSEAVEAYLRYCRDLIRSMRKRGAMRHSHSGPFHRLRLKHRDVRSPVHDSTERDIGVAITESGELVRHLGGKHRTAIAQALNLPSIPVEIRLVHTGWLVKQMERTALPPHQALIEGIGHLVATRI
jgi:hypothetical protein